MDADESMWVNLKMLAILEPGQKLNTHGRLFTLTELRTIPLPQWLRRWLAGSSRRSNLMRVKELYAGALQRVQGNERLVTHLRNSLQGIRALRSTYSDDVTTVAQLDNLYEQVEQAINAGEILEERDDK